MLGQGNEPGALVGEEIADGPVVAGPVMIAQQSTTSPPVAYALQIPAMAPWTARRGEDA
ncbi:MAG: hypothetical protein JOZ69_04990 [Myxococcales bacterium]|nr:hypothetical protein [Myxococcales bacterium]